MDIKELSQAQSTGKSISEQAGRQRSSGELSKVSVEQVQVASVSVSADAQHRITAAHDVRSRANEALTLTNMVTEAAGEIEKMVKSIAGITEQAAGEEMSPHQRDVLQREANDLVAAIKTRAYQTESNDVRPLTGDKIRLEVEEKLGKTLEFILPDSAAKSFGIGDIKFSTRDAIISTITTITAAQEQLQMLQAAVTRASQGVKSTVAELEVASRNSEAANVSVADLEEAVKLAQKTKITIVDNPESALHSVGPLSQGALGLLK